MTRIEMVEQAIKVLGDASADNLVAFVQTKHGEKIDPRFIPVFLASIRDLRRLEALRRERGTPSRIEADPKPRFVIAASERSKEAQKLALDLMAQHGLRDWKFGFNRRKQAMGLCVYSRRSIELSIHLVDRDNPWGEIRDTILHEIAHALVGYRHGHDRVWKRKCVEIGARPRACGDADMPEGKWRARCGGCGKQFQRHRKPRQLRGYFCQRCGPEEGKLVWREAG